MPQTRKLLLGLRGPPGALDFETLLILPVDGGDFCVLTCPLHRGQWHMDMSRAGGETQE